MMKDTHRLLGIGIVIGFVTAPTWPLIFALDLSEGLNLGVVCGFSAVAALAASLCGISKLAGVKKFWRIVALGWAPVSLASIVLWLVLSDAEFHWYTPLVLLWGVGVQIALQGAFGFFVLGLGIMFYQHLKSRNQI